MYSQGLWVATVVAWLVSSSLACRCLKEPETPVALVVKSPLPHQYLRSSDLPAAWDWRNVNGTNYCSKVMTQQSPAVCGSCWAEAATGAISDRFAIATQNKLRVQLAPQSLLNFNEGTSGGSCNGGSDLAAYRFMHKFGLVDDTCAPFQGLNWLHGFEVAAMTDRDDVRNHQCFICTWSGTCTFLSAAKAPLYSVDEYGKVKGVAEMKAEIYARGPISCSINSEAPEFDQYHGGIISCENSKHPECKNKETDHVIVIAGWGVDKKTGTEYWIGRNSYGSQWGEGAGGGWFRLRLGADELGLESNACRWAVPAAADVTRALQQFDDAL